MSVIVRSRSSKSKGIMYFLDIHHDGRRKKIALRVSSEKEARRVAARMEKKLLAEGWSNRPSKCATLADFTERYLAQSQASKALATYRMDRQALQSLLRIICNLPLNDISHQDIERFRLTRLEQIKPTSVNVELRHIKAAFSYAVENGFIKENPAGQVKLNKVPQKNHPRFLSEEEIKKLRKTCAETPDLLRMVDFALWTGMRRREITSLQWKDIDFKRRVIMVRNKEAFRTKSGKERAIPMTEQLEAMLFEASSDNHTAEDRVFSLGYWWFGKQFRRVVEEAKLPETTTIHTLRHTFASHLVMQGVDLRSVKEILGHHDISVTMVYSHLSPEHLANTVGHLPY